MEVMQKAPAKRIQTSTQILDPAEELVQIRGFNAFSYADVASELGITKAALHYHFATKAELGEALITRYATRFAEALAEVEVRFADAPGQLAAYGDLYLTVLREKRMCLCGMLAAEYPTLPSPMQDAVVRFFNDNETWLTGVLTRGKVEGTLEFAESPTETARMIVSGFEGARLVARRLQEIGRFQAVADQLLAGLRRTI